MRTREIDRSQSYLVLIERLLETFGREPYDPPRKYALVFLSTNLEEAESIPGQIWIISCDNLY